MSSQTGMRAHKCNARELGNCVGAAKDKPVYQLCVDEGNRRRGGDNS